MIRSETPSAHPDLEALRRSEPAVSGARRPLLPRLTVLVLVVGLLGAAYAVLRPVLFPPRLVAVAAVRPAGGEAGVPVAASLQAAGWVEAEPFPVSVRPLVKGVVATVEVLEGTSVHKDQTVLAVLRNPDLENALVQARAEVELRTREHALAQAVLDVARSLLDQKLPLRETIARRQGELAVARAQVDRARARRKAGEAALEKARVDLTAQRDLEKSGYATPTALSVAAARVREAEERVTELRFDEVRYVAELAQVNDLLDLAREALQDPRELAGRVTEAEAGVARSLAARQRADADLQVAERNAALLQVKAPADGVVLRLECAPGALAGPMGDFKGMGEGAGSTGLLNRMTGAICTLYDPAHLQVRVDVPYADLPAIADGGQVEIEAKALPGHVVHGVVDRLVREADITQAKLQVKVRLLDPDPALRPEMLCTARFLAAQGAAAAGKGPVALRVEVPSAALRGDAVFVHDPTGGGRARRVGVRVLRRGESWSEVEGDLGPSAKVILDEVEDGEAVKVKR